MSLNMPSIVVKSDTSRPAALTVWRLVYWPSLNQPACSATLKGLSAEVTTDMTAVCPPIAASQGIPPASVVFAGVSLIYI